MRRLLHTLLPGPGQQTGTLLFALLATGILVSIALAVLTETWWLIGAPAGLLLLFWTLADFHRIFFLLIASIPVSIEMELPGGLGTDLPSEPLMWLLTLSAIAWFLRNYKSVDARFVTHPISLLLALHLAWMCLTAITSTDLVVSLKFIAAKAWYVITFFFLAAAVLQNEKKFAQFVWWFFLPLLATVLIVLARHAPHGFSFQEVNYVMGPFYRNHVVYACIIAVFIPFVWFAMAGLRRYSGPWLILAFGLLIFLTGINFAYTRAAYVALLAAIAIYWAVRLRVMKWAIAAGGLVLLMFAGFVGRNDNWLEFAPDYERTVTHARFDNLLEATTKLEDISTMERVYRWVAAAYMIREKPLMGFGPGNFYFHYKDYTVSSFKTYVSDNPERSGIHNYYLMTAVEQGAPGAFLFILLCLGALLYGEQIYHRCPSPQLKRRCMAALLCFALIVLLMLMNDFVETDKIGSLFFISLALLVNADLAARTSQDS